MSNKYPHLPGIEVQVADGGLIIPEDATTQSMLIMAHSFEADAPSEPVLVRESNDLLEFGFGTFTSVNGSVNPIAAGWKAAVDGGCRQVYLVAIKGKTERERFADMQDKLFGILADFNVDNVVVLNAYADQDVVDISAEDMMNEEDKASFPLVPGIIRYGYVTQSEEALHIVDVVTGESDTITIKVGSKESTLTLKPVEYDGTDGKTLVNLADDIQGELDGAAPGMKAEIQDGRLVIVGEEPFTIVGGTALQSVGIKTGVAPKRPNRIGGIFHANYARLLADYANTQTLSQQSVVCYIGTKAPVSNSLGAVKQHVDRLLSLHNEYDGKVQVVAAPELGYTIPGHNGLYYTSGVVTYAALVAGLRPESAPTNKPVYGVGGIWFNLSLRQLNSLTQKKYVTLRIKNGRIIVTDGVTTAPDLFIAGQRRPSDFTRLSTLRITQAAVELVREIVDPFIGQPNRMPQYNSLNAAIKGGLEAMQVAGAINDYRFSIVADGATLNEAKITLDLIPAFELRKVRVDVSLRPELEPEY